MPRAKSSNEQKKLRASNVSRCILSDDVKLIVNDWTKDFRQKTNSWKQRVVEEIIRMCKNISSNPKYLGGGSYGQVFAIHDTAVKFIVIRDSSEMKEYFEEVDLTEEMGNNKIGATLYTHFMIPIRPTLSIGVIVMELGKDTEKYIAKCPQNLKRIEKNARDLIQRMLDTENVCTDLKPGNSAVFNGKLKLIDFGTRFCTLRVEPLPRITHQAFRIALNVLLSSTFALHANVMINRDVWSQARKNKLVQSILFNGKYPKKVFKNKKQQKDVFDLSRLIHRQIKWYAFRNKLPKKKPEKLLLILEKMVLSQIIY